MKNMIRLLLCGSAAVVFLSSLTASAKISKQTVLDIVRGESKNIVDDYLARKRGPATTPEEFFMLAMAHTQLKQIDEAMACVHKALDAGLPFERFLIGPRNLLESLYQSTAFKALAAQHPMELLHGPMLGAVTDHSARFWVRTVHEVSVEVRVSTSQDLSNPKTSRMAHTIPEMDYTGIVEIKRLKPDTVYYYDILLNGERVTIDPQPWFRTYYEQGTPGRFQVGFGGGANVGTKYEYMWDTVLKRKPAAFFFLGDNNYYNIPDVPEHQQYYFYLRESAPEFRRLSAASAIYAIWDDHDFAGNDSIGGPQVDVPAWKPEVLKMFKQHYNNPYYGGGNANPGVWFDFSIGDVDFFMLDCRYYHTDPLLKTEVYIDHEAPYPSMLGPVQKEWLLKKLKSSKATFKVLASSVPWVFGAKPGTQMTPRGRVPGAADTWEGFPNEREDIFSFIEENRIEGVYLISADRHRSDAWKIERPNGYDFYEANTSHLTKVGSHSLMPQAIFSHKGKPMYGLLTFDTLKDDPEITYQVIDIEDNLVDTLIVKHSQLTFKE